MCNFVQSVLSFADVQICFCTVWVAALGYERDLFCKSKNMYDNIYRTKTSSLAIQNRRFNNHPELFSFCAGGLARLTGKLHQSLSLCENKK